ncbi:MULTISPECIES: nitroreductase [Mycobacterium]|uniref:Peptidase n=1 Tax=Mycobacterium kiyosense TaxID=2871094 RepID=A0A9P3UTA3_9MYCO|nr:MULTISPECIES: nitroreductase [Mycobacterium]BDB43440.1 peptidase [Mycobacterium kiyosense]BDE13397.1 peptidase [Mycobacterium sp. 20KCMC460]GLB86078.1 peptidase [Mycobacterium kiyosense]GLB88330.1 peptidase [Mycobacterium kiyosense]GLB94745.1 peptidase [Mycobacterium kiyosense]
MPTYRNPHVRDAVRQLNKRVTNPLSMALAGRRYWYASVIRHTGRNSGRRYQTPVVVITTPDKILVPLPYGTGVDWLRNVLAAGSATVVTKGRTVEVVQPRVIDAATAEPQLPGWWRWITRTVDVDNFLEADLQT